jgi:hypothetical protein
MLTISLLRSAQCAMCGVGKTRAGWLLISTRIVRPLGKRGPASGACGGGWDQIARTDAHYLECIDPE